MLTVGVLLLASCVPVGSGSTGSGPGGEPPLARAIINPTSGPAGTIIDVTAPDDECTDHGFASLQATVTHGPTGYLVTTAYQNVGGSFSNNASDDPMVRLRIPPFAAAGSYLVYLSCYSYLGSYQYAPATFRVIAV